MVRNIILTEMDITMLNLKIFSNILKNEKECYLMETCNDCIHVAVCGEPHIIYRCSGVCQHFKRETKLNMYDKCEVIEGCTVEILTNTLTGETSVGWWRGEVEDRPGMEGET